MKDRGYREPVPGGAQNQAQIQFRCSKAMRNRLFKEADRRSVSVNFLIERALEQSLVTWEKQKLP